ncbi:MAG: carboxypeptidase-like regulatory domain-containing protein, partial [Holophagales bacterium]|nr:carboxypeptidase-like regulatory domain-containing protein [Holophagales bacterium]
LTTEIGSSPLEHELRPAFRITGFAVDAEGNGIRGVGIQAKSRSTAGRRSFGWVQTKEDGSFELGGLAPEQLRIRLSAQGFVSEQGIVDLSDGRSKEGLRFQLSRGLAVRGRLTAAGVETLARTRVEAVPRKRAAGGETYLGQVDAEGRFEIIGLSPGPAKIEAHHPQHGEASLELEVVPGMPEVTLRLERGHPVRGRVVDTSRRPVSRARFELRSWPRRFGTGGTVWGSTDWEGRFETAPRLPGSYDLAIWSDTLVPVERRIELGTTAVEDLEIVLRPGGAVRGRIRGLAPEQLQRVSVLATWQPTPSRTEHPPGTGSLRRGILDHEGNYRVEGLSPGRWKVSAGVVGTARAIHADVQVADEDREHSADLVFDEPVHALEGRVLHNGLPASDAKIRPGAVGTDGDGRFRIEGLPPGQYELWVSGPWDHYHRFRGDTAMEGSVTIEIETRRVRGRLLDWDGLPVPRARIDLFRSDDSQDSGRSIETDANGSFELRALLVGTYRLTAYAEGRGTASRKLEVVRDLDDQQLRLRRPGSLKVHARRTDGKPIEYLAVGALGEDGSTIGSGMAKALGGGVFQLDELPRGTWNLWLDCSGCVPIHSRATLPGATHEVVFEPATRLLVFVPSLEDSHLEAALFLHDSEGNPWFPTWKGPDARSWPVRNGSAALLRLPAGTWSFEVQSEDGRTFTGQATTAPGPPAVVELH